MRPTSQKRYLLVMLLVLLAFNNTDWLAFGLLLQNIKTDLELSDTQLGFLSGIAFSLFYALMGVPIARWADRGNRVTIISVTGVLWGVLVALCGMVTSFKQLLLIRTGVATGQAGCLPPAYSLLGDYFSRAERPRAVSIFLLGGSLSFLIGYFLVGWHSQLYGWRHTFELLGVVGLLPPVLAWFTLKEPRCTAAGSPRGPVSGSRGRQEASQTLRSVARALWSRESFRHLLFSFAVASFFSSGVLQWLPTFFVRSYGLETGTLGTWFGLIWGLGGLAGTYLGGELASRFAANNECLQLKAMAVAYGAFALLVACIYCSHDAYIGFAAMALAATGIATTNGPVLATIQSIAPPRMRATSVAFIYLCSNLIGTGLGPLAVGGLSDALRPVFHDESLRYALLLLSPGYLWGGWHLWRASQVVAGDLREAGRDEEQTSFGPHERREAGDTPGFATWTP